jgi:hypothetical protein
MKSIARLSVWVLLMGSLCFAPSALAQSSGGHHGSHSNDNGGSCGNQGGGGGGWGGGGWGGGGWDGGGWGGGGNGGGCTPVPEGGTTLMYLSIAGLCCCGALVVRSRKQTGVSEAS